MSVRNADGKEVVHGKSWTNEFGAPGCQAPQHSSWRITDFAKRSTNIDSLVEGPIGN